MITAAMVATAVTTAGMAAFAVLMIVMIAPDIRIKGKLTCKKGVHCIIARAADAAVKLNTGLGKRHLRAAANAAAD